MATHRHAANRLSLATSILHQPRTLTPTPIPATSILHQQRTPPPPRGSTRPAPCQSSGLAPLRRLFVAAPLPPPLALPLALPPVALPPPPRLRPLVRPARHVRRRSGWRSAPPFWMATSRPTQKRTSRHQRCRHRLHGRQHSRQHSRRQRRSVQRRRHGCPPVLPWWPRLPLPLFRPPLPTTTHSRASSARLFGR